MHAEGHLVLGDAGGDLRVVHDVVVHAVERLHRVDHVALALRVDASGPRQVQHRVAAGAQVDPLEAARQETAVPLPLGDRLRLAETAR